MCQPITARERGFTYDPNASWLQPLSGFTQAGLPRISINASHPNVYNDVKLPNPRDR